MLVEVFCTVCALRRYETMYMYGIKGGLETPMLSWVGGIMTAII